MTEKTKAVYNDKNISQRMRIEISSIENEIRAPISEHEFQNVLEDEALAFAIMNREKGEFLQSIRFATDGESAGTRWTKNLRDAFVFHDRLKATNLAININGTPRGCTVVPLTYQLDPLYKHLE
ncbi:hypothetical protein ACXWYY_000596 [Enterobacter hormaechei]